MLDVYPHLNKLHVPFLALTGPLWYLYVRILLTGDRWTKVDRWHLLPAISSILLSLPFFLQSAEFKRVYVEIEVSGIVTLSIYIATRVAELATIVYLAMAIRQLQAVRGREGLKLQLRGSLILLCLTTVALIAALGRLLGSVAGNHIVSVLVPCAMILLAFIIIYCLSHRHPWLMALGIREPRATRVTDEDKDRLERYRDSLRVNRWYLDPNLKIQQLARRLGVPPHELSELINKGSGGNFNNFVNALRIEYAKEMLLDREDRAMLDIALASGFNNTSAFYAQFKRFESVPPAAYRRRARVNTKGGDETAPTI